MADTKKPVDRQSKAGLKRKQNDQSQIPFKRKCESTSKDSTTQGSKYDNMSGRENFEFFYGNKSPFSQHHPATFKIKGITFNCAEQYMMYQKAVIFEDKEFKIKIMTTSDPVQQKRFGRKVRKFDVDVWKKHSTLVVERANEAKFSQNPDLKKQLFATHPRLLVESSPRDRVWGIGLGKDNPKAWNMKTWRGRNLLGHALTRVRDKLMEEERKTEEEKTMKGKVTEGKDTAEEEKEDLCDDPKQETIPIGKSDPKCSLTGEDISEDETSDDSDKREKDTTEIGKGEDDSDKREKDTTEIGKGEDDDDSDKREKDNSQRKELDRDEKKEKE